MASLISLEYGVRPVSNECLLLELGLVYSIEWSKLILFFAACISGLGGLKNTD